MALYSNGELTLPALPFELRHARLFFICGKCAHRWNVATSADSPRPNVHNIAAGSALRSTPLVRSRRPQ
jgi:hypothetical protein